MSDVITFDLSMLPALKAQALAHPLKRARINLHPTLSDPVQEMVICEHHSTYVRPHRHPGRVESFHMIQGALTVVVFDDVGGIRELVRMGDGVWGRVFDFYSDGGVGTMVSKRDIERPRLCRQLASVWHTVVIESSFAVVHEVVPGPFPYETEWAPWAPQADDMEAAAKYMAELREKIK